MDKQLKLAIGAAAVVGIGYYIYQINKPRILPFAGAGSFAYSQKIGSDGSMTVTPKFANASGSCPVGAVYTITPALPASLKLDSATGIITGTPTAIQAATTYTIKATNSGGSTTATWVLTVSAVPAPKLGLYTPATVVTSVNGTAVNSTVVNSGAANAEFSITPALPDGITIDKSTGKISGVATVTSPLTVYTVTASMPTPMLAASSTAKFTLTVNNQAPSGLSYTATTVYVGGVVNSMPSCMTGVDTSAAAADGTKSSAKLSNDIFSQGRSLYL